MGSPKDYGKPKYGQLMAGPQMIAYVRRSVLDEKNTRSDQIVKKIRITMGVKQV